jgi:hypothetical protein
MPRVEKSVDDRALGRSLAAALRQLAADLHQVIQRELTNLHVGVTGRQHDKSTCASSTAAMTGVAQVIAPSAR